MAHNLSNVVKTIRLPLDTTTTYVGSAGTTDLTTEGVDTLGYSGACFKVAFGAITANAVTSVKAAQSSDNGVADGWSDIAGSSVTVADDDDNQVVIIDIYHPQKRYLEVIIDRGTQNAVVDYMEVQLYGPLNAAVTQDTTTVVSANKLNSPAEGTA